MTTHDDTTTTALLRDLDPADGPLDGVRRGHAAATLARILATDPDAGPGGDRRPTGPPPAPRPAAGRRARRRRGRRGPVVPAVTGGSQAFATWSPTPHRLTGPDRAAALEACRTLQGDDDGELALAPGGDATALLAEARGGCSTSC